MDERGSQLATLMAENENNINGIILALRIADRLITGWSSRIYRL